MNALRQAWLAKIAEKADAPHWIVEARPGDENGAVVGADVRGANRHRLFKLVEPYGDEAWLGTRIL